MNTKVVKIHFMFIRIAVVGIIFKSDDVTSSRRLSRKTTEI